MNSLTRQKIHCPLCDGGVRLDSGLTPEHVALIDDRVALDADPFCSCTLGEAQRITRAARARSALAFVEKTERQRQSAIQSAASNVIRDAGIPRLYANCTLASLRARIGSDPEKGAALKAAAILQSKGEITMGGVTKRSILLWGGSGSGKTGCLAPVYAEFVRQGKRGVWLSMNELLNRVRSGYDDGTAKRELENATYAEVLFIDDLGMPWRDELSPHSVDLIDLLFYRRHLDVAQTLMTSSLNPSDLAAQLSGKTWRRIEQMAVVLPMGEDAIK